jgi:hypothetical protein
MEKLSMQTNLMLPVLLCRRLGFNQITELPDEVFLGLSSLKEL